MKRNLVQAFFTLLLIVIVGVALWTWISLTYVYSNGERAGYVQKFSKRGWLAKTWEGEMAMVNLPGAMPEIFYFTVRDEEVARKIQKLMGNRVVLVYNQHRGIPSRLFGDTSYFIIEVRSVPNAETPESLPVQDQNKEIY